MEECEEGEDEHGVDCMGFLYMLVYKSVYRLRWYIKIVLDADTQDLYILRRSYFIAVVLFSHCGPILVGLDEEKRRPAAGE